MENGQINSTNERLLGTPKWWKSKRKWERIGMVAATLIVVVLIIGLTMVFISVSTSPEICSSSTCSHFTKDFQSYIDTKIHPCDDFYRFSCGNFLENTNLDNLSSRSATDITEDEIQSQIRNMLEQPIQMEDTRTFNLVKKFYRACMNESSIEMEGLKKIKQIFDQIGGWPTLEGNKWKEEGYHWTKAVLKLRQIGINFNVFFQVSVDKDKGDNSSYVLGIHDMNYGPPDLRNDLKKMYIDFLTDIAKIFGANTYTAQTDSEEVLQLLLQIAKIYRESLRDNSTQLHDRMNLSELSHQHPTINWYHFLNTLMYPVDIYIEEIIVQHPNNLKKIEELIRTTPKRQLANFIVWHTLQYLMSFAPYKVANRAYQFIDQMNGRSTPVVRWKKCLEATEERLGPVISAAYIQKFVQEDTRDKVIELVQKIKEEFRKTIMVQLWLDHNTKRIILNKLMASRVEIPYYEILLELLEENRIYDHVAIYEGDFLQSAMNIDALNFYLQFNKLGKRVEENWWGNLSFIIGTDIEYSTRKNALIFPLGVFRGPFYHPDRFDYMNYGTLSSLIAHEISHVFIRAEYGSVNRELRTWWSPGSLLEYEEKLECLHDQYGKFVITELNKHLQPENTRDEDFADLAGAKIAYNTYINRVQESGAEPLLPGLNYSTHQLFWISSAIRHCSKYTRENLERYVDNYRWSPHQFRVIGPLQNLKEFATDFGCRPDSNMNPTRKCLVWSIN